jgi:hypothetical protein
MKLSHILLIIYISVICNSLVIFVFGDKGILEYESLSRYKSSLTENIANIMHKNKTLNRKLEYASSSKGNLEVLSREMGYYKKGEKVIFLDGYAPLGNFYEIGRYMNDPTERTPRNPVLRIIVLCCALTAIVLYAVFSRRNKHGHPFL